jgi:uncharacterized protein YdeI (YjbR/CyaY-like superfamily)
MKKTQQEDHFSVLVLPADFENEMRLAQVIEVFEKLPYSRKQEYIQWVEEAKKPETRVKRIEESIKKLRNQ